MKPDTPRARFPFASRWLRSGQGELPILMYHKVKPVALDPWTVGVAELDRQLAHLKSAGYRSISCQELINHLNGHAALPARPVLITFDDGYSDNLLHACPLLERHGLRATMFLPVKFIGGENEWDGGGERLLSYDELRTMPPDVVEFGLHSYAHGNYRRMSLREIETDLRQCIGELETSGIPFIRALAYPYGRDPARRLWRRRSAHALLESLGIECGLRIGNRVNRLPIADRFALQRIDIRSADTLEMFCRKLEGK
jgi:peptidoglycan/xylan/chitin deacetylase (PgdA/CDA1 family)